MSMEELIYAELIYEVFLTVSQGNPGAITVVTQLLKTYPGEFMGFVDKLVSLSLVGSELWVKYKECGNDLSRLAEFLRTASVPSSTE